MSKALTVVILGWDAIGAMLLFCFVFGLLFIAGVAVKDWFFDQLADAQWRAEKKRIKNS